MQTIVNVIIATATALMVPVTTSDLNIPEPRPLTIAHVVEQSLTEKEIIVDTVQVRATTTGEVACNCYNILREKFSDVPRMLDIQKQANQTFGSVAVFMYPPTETWPTGIPHVAVTTGVIDGNMFEIEEYNFKRCTHSYRFVSFNDVRLNGFIDLQALSPSLSPNESISGVETAKRDVVDSGGEEIALFIGI